MLDSETEAEFAVEHASLPAPAPASGWNASIPVTLVKRCPHAEGSSQKARRLPVVVWLHATGASASAMQPRLLAYADLGFLAVAIDCRYHGARAAGSAEERRAAYQAAVHQYAPSPLRVLGGQTVCR